MEQMIVEMTYITKGKTLLCARRVSLNFWDWSLLQIFKTSVSMMREFMQLLQTENNDPKFEEMVLQAINCSVSLSLWCLSFEFTGVLLDETVQETTSTHFPITWREPLEDLATTDTFFNILLLPQL